MIRAALTVVAVLICGAAVGFAGGLLSPAHLEIAGSDAAVRLHPGQRYDEVALGGSVLTGRRASDRTVLGEPLGVVVHLDLDPSTFVNRDGSFDANVLPAYVQTFSDPAQLAHDVRWAITKHLIVCAVVGAGCGLLILGAVAAIGAARRGRVARLDAVRAQATRAVWARQRTLHARIALGLVVIAVLGTIPSGVRHPPAPVRITPNPILASTPLAGTEVGGLLRPALNALERFIKTYFADSDTYYDDLRDAVVAALESRGPSLPTGTDVENVLFVTDRHCNIGMDRVIVAVAEHYDITTLVSGGDDAFSGSFGFESACTANLAAKSQQAGMTDVFVAGNHDSRQTIADERDQHIEVLDGNPVDVGGLTYVGLPDPRTSRYGEGIRPHSPERQHQLLLAQGRRTGSLACASDRPAVVVLHARTAGLVALRNSCGKALIALDGHAHAQTGPTAVLLADSDKPAYQYVGASTGGAPSETSADQTFISRLTVGPLHHKASINIVSIDRRTGTLLAVTVCHITPLQTVSFEQLPAG